MRIKVQHKIKTKKRQDIRKWRYTCPLAFVPCVGHCFSFLEALWPVDSKISTTLTGSSLLGKRKGSHRQEKHPLSKSHPSCDLKAICIF